MVSLLLVAWLVGIAVANSPFVGLASQVRRSVVIDAVDQAVPGDAKGLFASFRKVIDDRGFPKVFGDLVPDPRSDRSTRRTRRSPAQRWCRRSRSRVYKITGVAKSCSKRIEGTGFLYAPERVMTNAHVVAGVRNPDGRRRTGASSTRPSCSTTRTATSPSCASRASPGRPLAFTGPAATGDSAIVVGYPQDGPYRADAARVRGTQDARGPNIYESKTVVRQIYALRARVRPGNSGGPLLDPQGRVFGVVFAAAADDPQTGYALTAKEVSGDAARGRTATAGVSTQRCD